MKKVYVWFVSVDIYDVKNVRKSTNWQIDEKPACIKKKVLKSSEIVLRIYVEKMSISRLFPFCWYFLSFFLISRDQKEEEFWKNDSVESKYQKTTFKKAINNWVGMKKRYVWFVSVNIYGVKKVWKSTNWQIDEKPAWLKKKCSN